MEQFNNFLVLLDGLLGSSDWFPLVLVGVGIFFTFYLGFPQLRYFSHAWKVTTGKYDDDRAPGDTTHFQALSTALSGTVGTGNIGGVGLAIFIGGPAALFWMWVTAFVGMATKLVEVSLSHKYREVAGNGTMAGGPMYYMEKALNMKWLAVFFAIATIICSFGTGNLPQSNNIAVSVQATMGIPPWVTGLVLATLLGMVIIGGIHRIAKVAQAIVPTMAALYFIGALAVILMNIDNVVPSFLRVFADAFTGSAATGGFLGASFAYAFNRGVNRGLFSNEAGQGSAPIAHASAKADEHVSEGMVSLLEPFIDTIIICTITGIVIVMTQVWDDKHPTELVITSGDVTWVAEQPDGDIARGVPAPSEFRIEDGLPVIQNPGDPRFGWHSVAVDEFFTDPDQTQRFSGVIYPGRGIAVGDDGREYRALYGNAVETGAPLTMLGFRAGIPGDWGHYVVVFGVLLFAISTAISWSYYGDRCANYLFGAKAVIPYRIMFVIMHFVGAVASLDAIWSLGDVFLAIVVFPNLIALLLLSGKVAELTKSYFERRPWEENARVHAKLKKAKAGH